MIFIVKDQDEIYSARETGRITVVDAMVIVLCLDQPTSVKVRKAEKIRNRYNQVPHLTQDTT